MDDISELIAAGESVIKYYANDNAHLNSSINNSVNHEPSEKKGDHLIYSNKQYESDDKDECQINKNFWKNSNQGGSQYNLNYLSQDLRDQSEESNSFPEEHLHVLKEDCSTIFSLSHFMASSLSNANRLLKQLSETSCSDDFSSSSQSAHSLSDEIDHCKESCVQNETKLKDAGLRIFHTLGQLGGTYHRGKEMEQAMINLREKIVSLLDVTKNMLEKNNLKHLLSDFSETGCSSERLLDELNLRLTLLTSELSSIFRCDQTIELEAAKVTQKKSLARMKTLEDEFSEMMEVKSNEVEQKDSELKILREEYEITKQELNLLQKDREVAEKVTEEQFWNLEQEKSSLSCLLKESTEALKENKKSSVFELENHRRIVKNLEEEIERWKSKLKEMEEERSEVEVRADELERRLSDIKRAKSSDLDDLKSQLVKSEHETETAVERNRHFESEIARQVEFAESLAAQIDALTVTMENQKVTAAADVADMQQKFEMKSEEVIERESKVRSLELTLLQLQTDLSLEAQKNESFNVQIDHKEKQVQKLEEKVRQLLHFCPREVRIKSGLNQVDRPFDPSSELKAMLEDSESREKRLTQLLAEKDSEIKLLQQSLGEEIALKNQELDVLSSSLENLEGEMCQFSRSGGGVDLSSRRTSSPIGTRSSELASLRDHVRRISLTAARPTSEVEDPTQIQQLKGELKEAKKAARVARDEARKERVEAAKLKQQLAFLKIDLESEKSRNQTLLETNSPFKTNALTSDLNAQETK